MRKTFIFILGLLLMSQANAKDLENTLYMDLKYGRVVIEMYPEKAPKHVARIKELVNQGFYNGLTFHRVIEGFMAQTGDPRGDGTGGSGKNIPAEFNDISHKRGVVSMARALDPDSADSQFFICLDDATFLDGQYTAWGRVVEGMEFVDKIKKGDPEKDGLVKNPDKIIHMELAAKGDKIIEEVETIEKTEQSSEPVKKSPAQNQSEPKKSGKKKYNWGLW